MTQKYVKDEFWTDPYIEELDPSEKLLFLYLLTNPLCNCAGIFEINNRRIAYETGFDKDMVDKIIGRFIKDGKIIREKDWIIIINFVKNQSNNPSILQGVQRILDSLPPACIQALTASPQPRGYYTLLNLTIPYSNEYAKKKVKNSISDLIDSDQVSYGEKGITGKPRPVRVNIERKHSGNDFGKMVISLGYKFNEFYKSRFQEDYKGGTFSVSAVARNISKYKEFKKDDWIKIIEFYFISKKSKELVVTLEACFSENTIMEYKQKNRPKGPWDNEKINAKKQGGWN